MSKLYFGGPLFTLAERAFNRGVAGYLEKLGHEVWLPQDKEPSDGTAQTIFEMDVQGIDWSDIVLVNMDGPDPDSGTCFEAGYAYKKKPIIAYRTDFRNSSDRDAAAYNLMLWASATVRLKFYRVDSVRDVADRIDAAIRKLPTTVLTLTAKESGAFLATLTNPPEPNAALQDAAKGYHANLSTQTFKIPTEG